MKRVSKNRLGRTYAFLPATLIALFVLVHSCQIMGQGWYKTYGGNGSQGFPSSNFSHIAVPTPGGGILVASYLHPAVNGQGNVYLFETDASGNLLQEKWIESAGFNLVAFDLQPLPGGGYVLVGSRQDLISGLSSVFLSRLTPEADVDWIQFYGTGQSDDYGASVMVLPDGFLVGGLSFADPDFASALLMKTDPDGNQLWRKDFFSSGGQTPGAYSYDGIRSPDNGVVLAGVRTDYGNLTDGHQVYVVKADEAGNLMWEHNFGPPATYSGAVCIAPASGDGYLVGGYSGTSPYCIRLDADGNLLWEKTWDDLNGGSINEIVPLAGGGSILAGNSNANAVPDNLLIRIDEDGNTLWVKELKTTLRDGIAHAYQRADSCLILCGATNTVSDGWDVFLAKANADGDIFTGFIRGNLHWDEDMDCELDPGENALSGWMVQVSSDPALYAVTDTAGFYELQMDSGSYVVSLIPPNIPYWSVCENEIPVSLSVYDTATVDFLARSIADCPYLEVDISAPFLRRCAGNTYTVHYCNIGTTLAEDAYVEVALDPWLSYLSSTLPVASQSGQTFTFDLGDVDVNECGSFQVSAWLNCDSTVLGVTHCTEAHIYPDSLCGPEPLQWDGSTVEVDVTCIGDSVVFTIFNTGDGNMSGPLEYIIIEDQIVLLQGDFELNSGESQLVAVPANGSTIHLEAQQALDHPNGMASTGTTLEGCGGWLSLGLVTQWAADDPNPFVDIDCQENIGSFDPNDKTGFPAGFTDEHLIEPGQELEYLLRFQNTGTDTAFRVEIVDQLPPELDLTSLRPGASSHPYTYHITPEGWPVFTFDPIELPDKDTNEPASHGFVRFRVAQQPGLPLGTQLFNTAQIFFDFNAPVQTNTTVHRLGQVFPWGLVPTIPAADVRKKVRISPNPVVDQALLQVEGIDPGDLKLVIVNVSGQIVREAEIFGTEFVLQRKDLPCGVYFFHIEQSGQWLASGKLMVR